MNSYILFKESFLSSFTSLQKKIIAIAAIAFACLAAFLTLQRCWLVYHRLNLKQDQRLEPNWINDHPDVSLRDLGLNQFHEVEEFLKKHGKELSTLNLKNIGLDDDQFKQLMQYCAHLNQLLIQSTKISDRALEHLKGMPLTSVDFSRCENLTDQAFEHLKGMPLTSVDFSGCRNLTDQALEHLKGMPLTHVNFWRCANITDKALAAFEKEMNI